MRASCFEKTDKYSWYSKGTNCVASSSSVVLSSTLPSLLDMRQMTKHSALG